MIRAKLIKTNNEIEFIYLNTRSWDYFAADIIKAIEAYIGLSTWNQILKEEKQTREMLQPKYNSFSGEFGTLSFYLSEGLFNKLKGIPSEYNTKQKK